MGHEAQLRGERGDAVAAQVESGQARQLHLRAPRGGGKGMLLQRLPQRRVVKPVNFTCKQRGEGERRCCCSARLRGG